MCSAVSCLTLCGGTDASFAPPIGYLQHVLLPTLQRLLGTAGAGLDLKLVRRGFYPKGGGEAVLQVSFFKLCCTACPANTVSAAELDAAPYAHPSPAGLQGEGQTRSWPGVKVHMRSCPGYRHAAYPEPAAATVHGFVKGLASRYCLAALFC